MDTAVSLIRQHLIVGPALVRRTPVGEAVRPKAADMFVTATVAGNVRVTEVGREYDTHHLVLDFGALPLPVLEGQSIGIVPPGLDANGRSHHPRLETY